MTKVPFTHHSSKKGQKLPHRLALPADKESFAICKLIHYYLYPSSLNQKKCLQKIRGEDIFSIRHQTSPPSFVLCVSFLSEEEMGSKWRKAKISLGVNLCLYVPKTLEEESRRSNDAVSLSPVTVPRPTTPVPSSSGLRLPRSFSKSSSKVCFLYLLRFKV